MFTGLIADLGRIEDVERTGDGVRLIVSSSLAAELAEGDSIAVNGVCLTATNVQLTAFSTDVMNETLRLSSLAEARPGVPVNLELAMRLSDRLGGHMVQGHVDGVGTVRGVAADGFSRRVEIEAGEEILRYVVHKGSITVDGVSLTVMAVDDESFSVGLIPTTLKMTVLGSKAIGDPVNLEVDVIAKYVEKMLGARHV